MSPMLKKGPAYRTPWGPRVFLRSTRDVKTESYMVYAGSVPAQVVDGVGQKMLPKGVAMRKITSGPGAGMIGPAQAGVADGREAAANDVGLNNTELPWQLNEGDREVAVVYEATAVQAWCLELNAGGAFIALTDATAGGLRGVKGIDIHFK